MHNISFYDELMIVIHIKKPDLWHTFVPQKIVGFCATQINSKISKFFLRSSKVKQIEEYMPGPCKDKVHSLLPPPPPPAPYWLCYASTKVSRLQSHYVSLTIVSQAWNLEA
jgi:hypothetical protein